MIWAFFIGGDALTFLDGTPSVIAVILVLVTVCLVCGIALPLIRPFRQRTSLKFIGALCLLLFAASPFLFLHYLKVEGIRDTGFDMTVTNPRYYHRLVSQWDKSLITHFPPEVPPVAAQMHFYYYSSLISGAVLQLRCKASQQQITILKKRYEPQATAKHWGGDQLTNSEAFPDFQTSDEPDREGQVRHCTFPKDYEILLLHAQGVVTSGIALSEKRNQVVYWVVHGSKL